MFIFLLPYIIFYMTSLHLMTKYEELLFYQWNSLSPPHCVSIFFKPPLFHFQLILAHFCTPRRVNCCHELQQVSKIMVSFSWWVWIYEDICYNNSCIYNKIKYIRIASHNLCFNVTFIELILTKSFEMYYLTLLRAYIDKYLQSSLISIILYSYGYFP